MSTSEKLSINDIARLTQNPSGSARIEIADKLTRQYKVAAFSPQELEQAEQIFRLLLKDAEVHVRRALAENLKEVKNLPRDMVLQLAHDVESIALPMLQFSEVLTEDDLVSIVNSTQEMTRQIAIAKRKNLPAKVSSALIDTENENVVENLLDNQTARIDGQSFAKIAETFSENEKILGALLDHSATTVALAERIMSQLSDNIRSGLDKKYTKTIKKLQGVFDKSREVAAMKFLGAKSTDEELMRLMNYLQENRSFAKELHTKNGKLATMIEILEASGKLTPFTALCMGSMSLFEITVARMAKIPIYNARTLAHDESDEGLKALYEKAGLPASMFGAVKLIVHVIRGIDKEKPEIKEKLSKSDFLATYMIEKIMTLAEGQKIDNINYFLSMISLHAKKESNK